MSTSARIQGHTNNARWAR